MSHPEPNGPPDLTPLRVGEVFDVIVFRSPQRAVQRAIFGVLAPIGHARGYRATYPQNSRTVLAPRD